jgi:hypothetical protein
LKASPLLNSVTPVVNFAIIVGIMVMMMRGISYSSAETRPGKPEKLPPVVVECSRR